MKEKGLRTFIGNKAFYKSVALVVIPIIVQQGITNLVNLLDNVMVGRLGTSPMSGVAVVNQLVFVFNLMIFGGLAGASIFGAQYYGKSDYQGFLHTVRFRLYFCLALAIAGMVVFRFWGTRLTVFYLSGEESAEALVFAKQYINVIIWGFIPFAIVQCLGGSLKDCSETVSPMQASMLAIGANLLLNYLLIYGKFGAPQLGVVGAALATVISRYLEMLFLLIKILTHKKRYSYLHGLLHQFSIPYDILKHILLVGTPLFLNETLWSVGMAVINMCYAKRGLAAVAATNINSTVWNLFAIVLMAMGNGIGILSGQKLGAGKTQEAKSLVKKLLALTVVINMLIGGIIIATSQAIPYMYKTEDSVRHMATQLIRIAGLLLPITAYVNGTYFTLRSGGRTVITFIFDCVYTWLVCLPLAYVLTNYTGLSVVRMYALVQLTDIIKAVIGTHMIKSGIWIKNVVS